MPSSNLTIRIDSDLKEGAASVTRHYGLDLSSAIRAFCTQIVNTGTIPLSFDYEQPNEESVRSVTEVDEMIASGSGQSFDSGRALVEAALS